MFQSSGLASFGCCYDGQCRSGADDPARVKFGARKVEGNRLVTVSLGQIDSGSGRKLLTGWFVRFELFGVAAHETRRRGVMRKHELEDQRLQFEQVRITRARESRTDSRGETEMGSTCA